MKQLIKDMLTGIDGESYDIGRLLWITGALAFIGLSLYTVLHGKDFDPQNWGIGYGSVLGGGGAGIGFKGKTEPNA